MTNPSTNRWLRSGVLAALTVSLLATTATAQDIANVPREKTLVLTPWGDQPAQFSNLENWNPYLTSVTHQRDVMQVTINEALFYTNLNTGELIPWQAESYEVAEDFMSATIHIRDGVTWSDGEAFTAEDVKFTLEALRDGPPEMFGSADFNEYVESVDISDDLTVVINFTKPSPRFVRDYLALGWENHYPMLPAHIWEGESITEFTNYNADGSLPIGTGAYKLVSTTAQQEVFDRRDSWWGAETGFREMPAPERIILTPVSGDDAMGQLHIANQVDGGRQLQIGTFEAARSINPNLSSWNTEGPNWGAPDGCVYNMVFNNRRDTWADRDLHWAVNHALDRSQLSNIAYEGSMPPVEFAISGYVNETYLQPGGVLQTVLDKYNVNNPSQDLVDQYMADAGYERNDDGVWAKDGEVLDFEVRAPNFIQPLLAPVTQQLRNAGFNATQAAVDDSWLPDMRNAEFDTMILVHCGSISEPVETLQHFHSKFAGEPGTPIQNIIAGSRYENAEYDEIIDRMLAIPSSTDPESAYMKDAAAALDIVMQDLPTINLLEELHVVTFNNTYWTGWPTAENPYVAPYTPWEAFNVVIHNLEPAQ